MPVLPKCLNGKRYIFKERFINTFQSREPTKYFKTNNYYTFSMFPLKYCKVFFHYDYWVSKCFSKSQKPFSQRLKRFFSSDNKLDIFCRLDRALNKAVHNMVSFYF